MVRGFDFSSPRISFVQWGLPSTDSPSEHCMQECSAGRREKHWKHDVKFGVLATLLLFCCPAYGLEHQSGDPPHSSAGPDQDWVLKWSDEFNGPNGSAPDPAKWTMLSGGNGWGNDELEYYTPRQENVRIEDGNLLIEALKSQYIGPDGVKRRYTSGRLFTRGRFSQAYGRFEARIKIPPGQGVWPAFWLLGDNFPTVGWPECGEIDVMENVDINKAIIRGSIHGPGYSARKSLTSKFTLPVGEFSDGFHIFAIEWEPQVIRFYVDGALYAAKTPADLPSGAKWVYDQPFFIILNLAVGGNLPANPDTATKFPQRMLVDYVRVYSRK